jgi:hypothetical protein
MFLYVYFQDNFASPYRISASLFTMFTFLPKD